jgi:large subunit ribosomal protein L23
MKSHLNHILVEPHFSEKSMEEKQKNNVHVFKVAKRANKIEIKKAVEYHFGVKVSDVQTVRVAGKTKRTSKGIGKRPDYKKAYVTIIPGSGEIEYFEGT